MTIHRAVDLARFWFPADRRNNEQVHQFGAHPVRSGAWTGHIAAQAPASSDRLAPLRLSGAASIAATCFETILFDLVTGLFLCVGRAGPAVQRPRGQAVGAAQLYVAAGGFDALVEEAVRGSRSSDSTVPKPALTAPSEGAQRVAQER
jgi:hypothetical protein